MRDEQEIEKDIQATDPTPNRLTPVLIDATIVDEKYWQPSGTTLTVCCLVLKNGYNVTGESAAADPLNFNFEIGRKIARSNAREKIWALEGYLLKETLHREPQGGASVSRAYQENQGVKVHDRAPSANY